MEWQREIGRNSSTMKALKSRQAIICVRKIDREGEREVTQRERRQKMRRDTKNDEIHRVSREYQSNNNTE